ncbi:hypothetical protein [Massilia sp. S19_KUP03_FR1]|uniref:hypothetical protein n=1 Tax=Massilia sp. S19_KUP03_FR1 TaxID=3025503 RepID=UPI002FCDBA9B
MRTPSERLTELPGEIPVQVATNNYVAFVGDLVPQFDLIGPEGNALSQTVELLNSSTST